MRTNPHQLRLSLPVTCGTAPRSGPKVEQSQVRATTAELTILLCVLCSSRGWLANNRGLEMSLQLAFPQPMCHSE